MHHLYRPVERLMREVGDTIVMPRFRNLAAGDISEKSPGDLVTVADLASEARLTDGLGAVLAGARIVGEEAAAADPALLEGLGQGDIWVIDPIDGTTNFAEGKRPFAIMIALLSDGICQAGWILDPASGRLCHAARGSGTWVDEARITARPTGAPRPVAAIALHFLSPQDRAAIETRATGKIDLVAIPRCAGEQYPRLFLGDDDITLFERALPWDHLPGALMLEEAGGTICHRDGTPYSATSGGKGLLAASSPAMRDRAIEVFG